MGSGSGASSAMTSSLETQIQMAQLMALESCGALALQPQRVSQQQGLQQVSGMADQDAGRQAAAAATAESSSSGSSRRRKGSLTPGGPYKRARGSSSGSNDTHRPQETTLAVAGELPPALPNVDAVARTPHYNDRSHVSLATDEDQNWLSEFQCFIRSEVLEVFRATEEDVRVRNNSKHLTTQQVGIRCRFCAHLPPTSRASRSSAFPSSVPQIYQSFTMMLRDHWPACQSIPSPQKEKFQDFKTKNNQGKPQ